MTKILENYAFVLYASTFLHLQPHLTQNFAFLYCLFELLLVYKQKVQIVQIFFVYWFLSIREVETKLFNTILRNFHEYITNKTKALLFVRQAASMIVITITHAVSQIKGQAAIK
jgi:hypothetical protein